MHPITTYQRLAARVNQVVLYGGSPTLSLRHSMPISPHYNKQKLLVVSLLVLVLLQLASNYVFTPSSSESAHHDNNDNDDMPHNRNHRIDCQWNDDDDDDNGLQGCFQLLETSTRSATFWYFLGDSTMALLFQQFTIIENDETTTTRILKQDEGSRRKLKYYGLKRGRPWYPPNVSKGEGPSWGADDPYKTECMSCINTLLEVQSDNNNNNNSISTHAEFLAVEYARDVEFPTPNTTTSQETVALYMAQRRKEKYSTVCVANVGLHDMKLLNMTTQLYLSNVRTYQRLLSPHCSVLVWLSMSAVEGNPQRPQRNGKIQEWNQAVLESMKTIDRMSSFYYMDVFPKSRRTRHVDNIHLDVDLYYQPLSKLFWSLMTKSSATIPK